MNFLAPRSCEQEALSVEQRTKARRATKLHDTDSRPDRLSRCIISATSSSGEDICEPRHALSYPCRRLQGVRVDGHIRWMGQVFVRNDGRVD